jgi:hypothetical protein
MKSKARRLFDPPVFGAVIGIHSPHTMDACLYDDRASCFFILGSAVTYLTQQETGDLLVTFMQN